MKKFPFSLDTENSVIIVETFAEGYEIRLALDTAASQTVLDWNVFLILGYSPSDLGEEVPVETANGVLQTHRLKVKKLEALGHSYIDFEVLTYDFFEKGLFSLQDGVLELDFFQNTILTIDFIKMYISLQQQANIT